MRCMTQWDAPRPSDLWDHTLCAIVNDLRFCARLCDGAVRRRAGVDVVVSLCRVNDDDLTAGVEQIDIRLIDDIDPDANPNLDFVLTDTMRLIEQLRNQGRTVLLHCVACQSRTPTVAALYGARRQGISGELALQAVTELLPGAWPNRDFRKAIERLAP
jgi:ADP-ribosyl-[dinitrogen reductase] hydrolase